MPLTYLASPYSPVAVNHPQMQAQVREDRYWAACRAAAKLMREGRVVFCPIAHSHPIDLHFQAPESGDFWQRQDAPYLEAATELVVLRLPGWEASRGIAHEIARAEERGIPVTYMDPV